MSQRIEPHVACPGRGWNVFEETVFVRTVLMNYAERPIGIRSKRVAGTGVIGGSVDPAANGNRSHYPSCVVVGNCHHAAATTAKQPVTLAVNRHRNRLFARRSGPAPRDNQL